MFICKNCGSQIPSHTPSYLFTVEKRSKHYPFRAKAQYSKEKNKKEYYDDPGGKGVEIVKQIQVCKSCYDTLSKSSG